MDEKFSNKSVIKIIYVGAGNVLNAFFGFLFLAAAAKFLDISSFGKYALLAGLLVFLSKIMDFGTNSTFVSKSITTDEKELENIFISSKIFLFFISVIVSILCLLFLKIFTFELFLIFSLGLFSYALNYSLFGMFQRNENFSVLILINFLPALVKGIVGILIFMNIIKLNYLQMFLVFSMSIGFSSILYFFLPSENKIIHINFSGVMQFIKATISPGISQLITEGFSTINNFIAKIYSNFTSVGIYSLADKISGIFTIISFTIFTVLLPKNAFRKKDNKKYDFKESLFLASGVLLSAVLATFIAKIFIPWFFANKFNQSINILNILVFASALTAIEIFLENYFFVENKTKYLAYISITKLLILLGFSAILIPIYKLQGIAWSQFIASFITLLTVIFIISKENAKQVN